jgi:hypothetical protein
MSKFYTLKKENGIFWLVNPQGKKMFYTSVQCVGPKDGSVVKTSPLYDGIKLYGSKEKWADITEKRLKGWGFKGLGAWNDWLWHKRSLPFTDSLNIWKSLERDGGLKPIYDADWDAMAAKNIAAHVAKVKNVPNLIGYFLDNEIPWPVDSMRRYFDRNKVGDPNRKAVVDFLKKRYGKVENLNRAWRCQLASFEALAKSKKLPGHPDDLRADSLAFLGQIARKFFVTASAMVRKNDPNRLILGSRHAGMPAWEVVEAQAGATDVLSINIYRPEARQDEAALYRAHQLSGGQPLWITEFSFHSPFENRSGNRNRIGFGARVREQTARAKGYRTMVGHAASLPFMIGTDWFQFHDEPTEGRGGDGEDVNFGLVDIYDKPYEPLMTAVRQTNLAVDRLHAGSGKWRLEKAAVRELPAAFVPATKAGAAVLPGLKFRPTMDTVPAKPTAEARLSWDAKALHVTVDVACKQRITSLKNVKESIEWFWMSDAVDLMIRPDLGVPEALDESTLKVWAVPDGLGKLKPYVGGWRNHQRLQGSAVGVAVKQKPKPGGYSLEFDIPAALIQKGPFKAWQTFRFDMLVEDCRQVTEVYWSAHQGDWVTEKPNTWGKITLLG